MVFYDWEFYNMKKSWANSQVEIENWMTYINALKFSRSTPYKKDFNVL